jgi:hypothetical protein
VDDETDKDIFTEDVQAIIRRQKETAEKLEAALKGSAKVSPDERIRIAEEIRRIIDRLRTDPEFRAQFDDANALLLRQMDAIHKLNDEDDPDADTQRLH